MRSRREFLQQIGLSRLAMANVRPITLFLCGDVMTGRGIDQVLPHPSDPVLYEGYMKSALGYVAEAEQTNDPIPRRVGFRYIWGDALAEFDRVRPDLRMINLETINMSMSPMVSRRRRSEPATSAFSTSGIVFTAAGRSSASQRDCQRHPRFPRQPEIDTSLEIFELLQPIRFVACRLLLYKKEPH